MAVTGSDEGETFGAEAIAGSMVGSTSSRREEMPGMYSYRIRIANNGLEIEVAAALPFNHPTRPWNAKPFWQLSDHGLTTYLFRCRGVRVKIMLYAFLMVGYTEYAPFLHIKCVIYCFHWQPLACKTPTLCTST